MPKYLFPQLATKYKFRHEYDVYPFFIDSNSVTWLKDGKSEDEIIKLIMAGGIYKKEEIINMWNAFCEKICEREKGVRIAIWGKFIRRYSKFHCLNHCEMDMKEYYKQLCRYTTYCLETDIFIEDDFKD